MRVLVCLKRVPELAEAELRPAADGLSVDGQGLVWELNEWDAFALEWALRLIEQAGGELSVVSLGGEEDEEVLFRALAMGAGQAVRLHRAERTWLDPAALAAALAELAGRIGPDLILTGVQSADLGQAQVGVRLASILGWPYATAVIGLEEVREGGLTVRRELEGGLEERLEIDLPAVLTIQSNPNPPRYVSVLGIRKAKTRPLEIRPAQTAGPAGLSRLAGFRPVVKERAVSWLDQDTDEAARQLADLIRERG